jgi:Uncharacterised nucleotidyltransferase
VRPEGLWEGVDRLLEQLGPQPVSDHGLGALAARRLRLRGEEPPERLLREERAARVAALVAPALLARVRGACDGPLLLVKGPELSRRYPDGARGFGDLDLVAADAERVQAALLAAGFRLKPGLPPLDYERHHHLHPLEWPGLALPIEIHRRVLWPHGLAAPPTGELLEAAVPAEVGVDGLLVPDPRHHALLLAAHAWGEVPMRRLRQLVDVLAFTSDEGRDELERLARRWGFERGWRATLAAADWLLRGAPEPAFARVWARYLRALRDPTVFELHAQEWLSPFTLAPPRRAVRLSLAALRRDLLPLPHEDWTAKRRRIVRAVSNPLSPHSSYDRRFARRSRGEAAVPARGPGSTTE